MPELYGLSEDDVRRIYAKINAHDVVLKSLMLLIFDDVGPTEYVVLRDQIMELADQLQTNPNDRNREFSNQGRVDTLEFVAEIIHYPLSLPTDSGD